MNWLDALLAQAHQCLVTHPEAEEARKYLRARRVYSEQWGAYTLGFSSPSIEITECTKAFADWRLFWFNRIVFPVRNLLGHTIGIVTRPLPSDGEKRTYQQFYLHPPETQPFLFGLDHAAETIWRTRQIVLVEGVFDYFALAPHIPNTVAILTANVPQTARTFLTRYVRRVWAVLDMDNPGRLAAYKLAGVVPPKEFWPEGWTYPLTTRGTNTFEVKIVPYQGKDPGDLSSEGLGDLIRQLRYALE